MRKVLQWLQKVIGKWHLKEWKFQKIFRQRKSREKSNTAEKKISITEVRAVMAEKSRAGKTQEIKQLLKEFGADKLSSVPEERYEELMKRAEVL